jgi:acylphosphatase
MRKHLDIKISGRVQGVFFRYSAAKAAAGLAVTGGVKNEPDGTVSMQAEGDKNSLNKFVAWCRRGPPGAVVTKVVTKTGRLRNYPGFSIWF